MRVLDLFSGIGGFSLGLERAGMETVAFCEIEPFCQRVLRKHWPDVPIYEDIAELICKLERQSIAGDIDVITAGFPCQPASTAGKRRGTSDNRWLWPKLLRVVQLVRPTWCIFENVRGLLSLEGGMVFESCISDLEALGYEVQSFVIPACAVDAKHRRDRVWIVANTGHTESPGRLRLETDHEGCGREGQQAGRESASPRSDVANTECKRGRGGNAKRKDAETTGQPPGHSRDNTAGVGGGNAQPGMGFLADGISAGLARSGWLPEPGIGRVATGVPDRVNKLKALGNAVVPQIPEIIGRAIMEATK